MIDAKTENEKAKRTLKISVLTLKRETLRELDAGELRQAQGGTGVPTKKCYTEHRCTNRCV